MTPTAILLRVTAVLDVLGVEYAVVGSMASSTWGIPRSTNDADVVALLAGQHVAALVEALDPDFYIDRDAVDRAIRSGRSVNAIDRTSAFKVDIFVPAEGAFGRQQIARRRFQHTGPEPDAPALAVAAPEDVVLAKLQWFAASGSTSERQWLDLLGVMKIQGPGLDLPYMRQWAARLGVTPLLDRALTELPRAGD